MVNSICRVALLTVLLISPRHVGAQTSQDGRLIVTIVDSSGAVVPGANVTVTALDDGARAPVLPSVTSGAQGVATVAGLLPGRYRVQAEFPGFDIGVLLEVRVRRGDNKHVLVLRLKNIEESVTVAQNAQAAAADPRGNAFKTVLTSEEIANLSDDPAELAQQLQDLAGGNATIRVDSFAGAPLRSIVLLLDVRPLRGEDLPSAVALHEDMREQTPTRLEVLSRSVKRLRPCYDPDISIQPNLDVGDID
jgi:hypothetical protein